MPPVLDARMGARARVCRARVRVGGKGVDKCIRLAYSSFSEQGLWPVTIPGLLQQRDDRPVKCPERWELNPAPLSNSVDKSQRRQVHREAKHRGSTTADLEMVDGGQIRRRPQTPVCIHSQRLLALSADWGKHPHGSGRSRGCRCAIAVPKVRVPGAAGMPGFCRLSARVDAQLYLG